MRIALKTIGEDKRHKFFGTYQKRGHKKDNNKINTILLVNIKDENKVFLCDHLWFNETKGFKEQNLSTGDKVSFFGRIKAYKKETKGYRKSLHRKMETDYKIAFPTKVKVVKRQRRK